MSPTYETHLGYAEYFGKEHLYDGNDSPKCAGTKKEVLTYLKTLLDSVPEDVSISWLGQNGMWYSGEDAKKEIRNEMKRIKSGNFVLI